MSLFFIFLLLSVVFSFWCSVLEAGYLKITPSFVALKEKEGKPYAERLGELINDPGTAIGAILTLNTIAHTVGAIGVGAQTEAAFGPWANTWYIKTGVPVMTTLVILIFSEIIPKNIGAMNWQRLARFTTSSLNFIILALKYSGILWLLGLVSSLVGGEGGHGVVTTRREFAVMAEEGVKHGVFKEGESRIIQNLVRFNQILTKTVMTPRTVIVTAAQELTAREFYDKTLRNTPFSRIPVHTGDKDEITGYVLKDDVLQTLVEDKGDTPLTELKRELKVVNESLALPELFNRLMESREHMALVIDEYGGTGGLVTMEDVIESLLGLEIMDEADDIADMQTLAREEWRKRSSQMMTADTPEQIEEEGENQKSK